MTKKILILIMTSLIFISCASDTKNNQEDCTTCKGDKRLVDCPNQKPENSSWNDVNKNGKLEQTYDGEKFGPEIYDCFWICDNGYEKNHEICKMVTEEIDSDNDGINDNEDNCPNIANTNQVDTDNNGIGDACEEIINTDNDSDGIENDSDNCPEIANPNQEDINSNGIGNACEIQDGSRMHPFIIDVTKPYLDSQNTQNSTNSEIDAYPPNTLDESGAEYYYIFKLEQKSKVKAYIPFPEPENTDIDIHILSSLEPLTLIDRAHYELSLRLDPGVYYLVMDTFVDEVALSGNYSLNVDVTPIENNDSEFFNYYILEAIDYIDSNYRLLGYDGANLTHDIEYGEDGISSELHYGTITKSGGARTMCVSAQMEIILTALRIYAEDTGDYSVYEYLPMTSWKLQNQSNIKGHLWVHPDYSYGTGHALANFGMGIDNNTIEFEDLKTGGFINLNRTTGTGHAVAFLGFLDLDGNVYESYPSDVSIEIIGFKYYSAQGGYDVGDGGMDYRWAIFDDYDTPSPSFCSTTKKCDKNVIFSRRHNYLNVGMMWHPDNWTTPYTTTKSTKALPKTETEGNHPAADPKLWDGMTSYDLGE